MAIAVCGLYLLCMQNGFGGVERSDMVLLLCAVLFSFQIMAVNHYGPQVDGVRLSLRQFFVVAVESSVAALLLEHPAPAEFAVNAVPLLYCGVMSSGVAYTLQILGQRDMNPAVGSLIMCLESVFSALGGWVLLHQSLSPREGVGCVLIFAAVVLAQLPAPQRQSVLLTWPHKNRKSSCAARAASSTSCTAKRSNSCICGYGTTAP